MYDRKTNLTFDPPSIPSTVNWWPYPAIWTINEQRKGARSGVASWPQDPIPLAKYQAYARTRSKREIIDQILRWFNDPIEPINFGAIYFDEPDLTGSIDILLISKTLFFPILKVIVRARIPPI